MKLSVPPLVPFLRTGFQRTMPRLHLLLLLSVMNGLLSSIATAPSQAVFTAFFEALTGETQATTNASTILMDGGGIVLFGQVLSLALHAVFLVLWARAVAKGNLVPNEGGMPALLRRSTKSFIHLLTATMLSIVAMLILATAIYALTSTLGQLAVVLTFVGIIVGIWFIVLANAVAQFAIFYEAQDKRVSFAGIWLMVKPNALPIAAAFACYSIIALFANMLLGGILGQTIMEMFPYITLAIGSGLSFAASAVYVAALSGLSFTVSSIEN